MRAASAIPISTSTTISTTTATATATPIPTPTPTPIPTTTATPNPRRTPAWKRGLRFTRLGRIYVALTVGIGLGAINTGNNLLFLVLGLLLSSIVVSGILSESSLRGVRVERHLPAVATAGVPALIGLCARNGKARAPSFSLEVREKGGDVSGSAFLIMLAPGEAREVAYAFVPRRRGPHRFERLELCTRAPFGLFEKSRPFDAPAELIVFPRQVPAPAREAQKLARDGERPAGRAGPGLELHALRDHRLGEDARKIHWRSSARAGRLIAVEHEEERRRHVCVLLDHRGLVDEELERAVEDAAALFDRELSAGAEVGLALSGETLAPGGGEAHRRRGLTALALLEPVGYAEAPAPLPAPGAALLLARESADV